MVAPTFAKGQGLRPGFPCMTSGKWSARGPEDHVAPTFPKGLTLGRPLDPRDFDPSITHDDDLLRGPFDPVSHGLDRGLLPETPRLAEDGVDQTVPRKKQEKNPKHWIRRHRSSSSQSSYYHCLPIVFFNVDNSFFAFHCASSSPQLHRQDNIPVTTSFSEPCLHSIQRGSNSDVNPPIFVALVCRARSQVV